MAMNDVLAILWYSNTRYTSPYMMGNVYLVILFDLHKYTLNYGFILYMLLCRSILISDILLYPNHIWCIFGYIILGLFLLYAILSKLLYLYGFIINFGSHPYYAYFFIFTIYYYYLTVYYLCNTVYNVILMYYICNLIVYIISIKNTAYV